MLELRDVKKVMGAETHIGGVSLELHHGSLNVLLGPTLSGKTTLMRMMAGLERPTSGSIWFDGKDVTGIAPQKRNVAMVHQQFINYPAMSVYDNIASPLRLAKVDSKVIDRRVREAADLMKLSPMLDRLPHNLSGGQQQRTALARAIVKDAALVLLDEPLANLDYKLREELRAELPRIFAKAGSIFVYATTEPSEALLLGGNTVTLSQGRATQFGPTIEVFRRPKDLITAQTFADPPLNTITLEKRRSSFLLGDGAALPVPEDALHASDGSYIIGFQPHHLSLLPQIPEAVGVKARITVTEITGSESFVHLAFGRHSWVMLTAGIHHLDADQEIEVFIDPRRLMVFDKNENAVQRPPRQAA